MEGSLQTGSTNSPLSFFQWDQIKSRGRTAPGFWLVLSGGPASLLRPVRAVWAFGTGYAASWSGRKTMMEITNQINEVDSGKNGARPRL